MSTLLDEVAFPLSRLFSAELATAARSIESEAGRAFADAGPTEQVRCAQVAVASWAHELDKEGGLAIPHRDAALVYQLGRIAAQEIEQALLPRLQAFIVAHCRGSTPA